VDKDGTHNVKNIAENITGYKVDRLTS